MAGVLAPYSISVLVMIASIMGRVKGVVGRGDDGQEPGDWSNNTPEKHEVFRRPVFVRGNSCDKMVSIGLHGAEAGREELTNTDSFDGFRHDGGTMVDRHRSRID
jgi:hypothetical protein